VTDREAELLARAKADPAAFGELYERYLDRIYNYIYYRVGNHHTTEELTARTFYQALKNLNRYVHRGAPFSAWLYRIAHNVVANWHRDQNRRQIISLDSLADLPRPDTPERAAEEREVRETLLAAVRQLAPDRQLLLILKFSEGLSNAEIGRLMGRTEGAIKALYHRTLISLREILLSAESERG